ncbi:MAG: 5-formyltetrahydrofolate cyclo-ligase [Brachybacterium sp.]|uniref:5-formyltetrahydrofolate cyclo-ligase n=1 Tax=Brachybacterium sp. AOP35-5H-19 TaxID=3457685 RepID=UPI003FB74373
MTGTTNSAESQIAAHKSRLRRRLRSRREELYGGVAGAERRRREGLALSEHADELMARISRSSPDAGAGPETSRDVDRAARVTGADGEHRPLVATYHPTATEADVLPLSRRLLALGARLIFPASTTGASAADDDRLDWILWDGCSEFVDSPARGFGREPDGDRLGPQALSEAALVLAPAVAVDRSGTRIGHGAGYYDRALTSVPPGCSVLAVVHPEELLDAGALPRAPHDAPVPEVLTSDGLVCLVTIDDEGAPPDLQQS